MCFKKKEVKKIPVIIDCDTGIDDAVALMLAVKSEKLDIKLITTDVGNVNPVQAGKNCLNILELIGSEEIQVVPGDGLCLERERPRVAVHGNTGMGEYIFPDNSRKKLALPFRASCTRLAMEELPSKANRAQLRRSKIS